MDDLNVKAKAERQLALMYAKLSSAHRCLAIAQEDDSQWSKMHDMAENYFDEAEAIGREALGASDLYNAKLREVIRQLYVCAMNVRCNGCPYAADVCDFDHDLQLLGIEV